MRYCVASHYLDIHGYALELRRRAQACLNDVQDTAIVMFNSAADILKDVGSRVSKVKLPDIPEVSLCEYSMIFLRADESDITDMAQ